MTEPKKCPTGKYWCFTDKKCKKIPKGYHVMGGGRLMKDEDHEDGDENKNGGSNGNGDGGGVSENTILEKRDGKSAKDKGYSLRDWFKGGGWKQTGGKYDGKPCARQPGQKTKPFCRDADDRAAMSKKERNRRAAKKRREDPNPDRKGKAKIVTDSYAFSNWRKETNLQESDWTPVAGSIANSSSQTFHYVAQNFETGDPNIATIAGLGGVETAPFEVTVDLGFGERYPVAAPDYSQSSMQGYAQPLAGVNRRRDYEDVNPKLDASQEFAQNLDSDYMMNARVQDPKTTSVGYFSYMTPAEQLEQARDSKKRFAGGLGNHNFQDHVKGVVGYEKYQQLDDQRKANESAATKDIWAKYKEAISSGKYELTDKLQKQAEKIQNKVYKDFVSKVETLYFDEFKKQTGLDPDSKLPPDPSVPLDYDPDAPDPSDAPDPPESESESEPQVDPYADRILELHMALDKMREEGTLIARDKLVAPGEKGYVDTTKMANAIGYNRKPIYTAPAQEMFAELERLYALQLAWLEKQNPGGAVPGADDALDDYNRSMGPNSEPPEALPPNPNESVPTPDDDLLDQLANMLGVGSAKNFLDHYADNFVKGDGKQDQNLTNLLSKDDLNYLKNALGKDTGINNPKINRLSAPNSLYNIMQNAPRGIRNSIGNGATLDVDYFNRTGDYKIDKSYVFTEPRDFEARSGSNALSNIASLGTAGYARTKAGGNPFANASSFINNPMRFHVIIPGPKNKKKKVEESTWSKIMSKQVREDLNRRDRKVIGKMVADSYDFSNWRDEFKALEFETVDIIGTEPLKPTEGLGSKMLGEKCWKGYEKKGMKTMFGKRYPNCVKKEELESCPVCGNDSCQCLEGNLEEMATEKDINKKLQKKVNSKDLNPAEYIKNTRLMPGSGIPKKLPEEKKDPCWDTHKQVGMKKKNGRMVPNCVPKEETHSDWRTELFEGDGDHEYEMARRQLATIKNAVSRLEKKMGETGEGELKAWVQAKLTRSADDIDTVADYVTNEETIQEGEKDACYHKVKSRYSVWPSAYASGALVKCRKVGAKNWGNKSKTKKEEVQYLNTEDYQRIQEYGNVYTIIVLWRGKSHRLQLFFQGTARPSRDEVKNEVEKIYPGGMVSYYFPSATDPGKPIIVSTRS